MNPVLAQRLLALAGIALLAGLVALGANASKHRGPSLPQSIPAPNGGWFTALAASHGSSFSRSRTDCGYKIDSASLGVAHPVLPCGTKIYLLFKDNRILTQVLAHGPTGPGHQFELTRALASEVGLSGTQPIEWRYAR